LHHDLNYLTSAGLLMTATVTAITGIVAHLWDLNDFWYHTYAGYATVVFALTHVWLNVRRMVSYARFRFGRRVAAPHRTARKPTSPTPAVPGTTIAPGAERQGLLRATRRAIVSRRGFLALAVGVAGGLFVGRGLRQPPPIPQGSDLGVIYHEWSKPGVVDALGSIANWGQFPELYKSYPNARRIALPPADLDGGMPTARTIADRRSTREYAATPMSQAELAQVLFLATGVTSDPWGQARRSAPSSGALYPIETYAVVHNVEGLERGVYHYALREHALELVRASDFRSHTVDQALGQDFLGQCGAVLFLTQILQRMRPKYQDRSYRYGLLEAGHIGENAYLAAVSLGLGACGVGAFMDDQINDMLGVDGTDEAAVYMLAVGRT
jgi:SagB-type dehydrogenase family enzyme